MGLKEKAKSILLNNPDPKKISRGARITMLQTLFQPVRSFGSRSEKKLSLISYKYGGDFFKGGRSVFTSLFTPVEIVHSFDLLPFPLEPLGALASSFDIATDLLDETEKRWISTDFCSFHRAFLGACSFGLLPEPVFLMSTSHACDGTMKSFSQVAGIVSRPLLFIDVPYNRDREAVRYTAVQIQESVSKIESITGMKLRKDSLCRAFEYSNEMTDLLRQIQKLRHSSPPVVYGSETLNLLMVWAMFAGNSRGVKILKSYRDEIARRLSTGYTHVKTKKRLLWLHLRPYYSNTIMNMFEEEFESVIVAEETNTPVDVYLDSSRPWESIARKLLNQIWSGSIENRLRNIENLLESHAVDGVVHFSHWGCRQSNGAVRMIRDTVAHYGVPFLELDGDCVDPRNYAEGQYRTRIEAFLEILERK
jgi:benzoyl-CoA reductase/2-hydroxyglutaryl-CoA dehydratase subunit BcrC/BadD/HgdB